MSKRLASNQEEWSDDELDTGIDGGHDSGLWSSFSSTQTPSKRLRQLSYGSDSAVFTDQTDSPPNADNFWSKTCNNLRELQSNFSQRVKRLLNIESNPEHHYQPPMNQSMATNGSPNRLSSSVRGMNSNATAAAAHPLATNVLNTYRPDTAVNYDQSIGQNMIRLIPIQIQNNTNSPNFLLINQIQGPIVSNGHISGQPMSYQLLQPIRPQLTTFSANTSPSSAVPMNKCVYCGQVAASPIRSGQKCGHCKHIPNTQILLQTPSRTYRSPQSSITPTAIPANSFYSSSGTTTPPSSRPRVQTIRNSKCDNRLDTDRTLNASVVLNRLPSHESTPRRSLPSNPECIDLDEDIIAKPSAKVIDIKDEDDDLLPDSIGVQCKLKDNDLMDTTPRKSANRSMIKISNSIEIVDKMSPNLPITSFPDYIMFGTYRCEVKSVEFTADGIKLTNVSPNTGDSKFKYHIMIPFVEMQSIEICIDPNNSMVFVMPINESNEKIQSCLYLGSASPNGLHFDVNSYDPREHKIIIVLREPISRRVAHILFTQCKELNGDCRSELIDPDSAKLDLKRAQTREASRISSTKSFERVVKIADENISLNRLKVLNKPSPSSSSSAGSVRYNRNSATSTPVPSSRSRLSTPIRTPVQTVIDIDDDDDEETTVKADIELSDELFKSSVIFTYPKDEPNGIQIVGSDMECLNKGEFLNDNIVNFYLRYYYKEVLTEEMAKRCHIFDTLFFIQMTEKRGPKRKNSSHVLDEPYTFEQRYEKKLKTWTKHLDLFSKDFLVFPIIKESHWFLAIVCYPALVYEVVKKAKVKQESSKSVTDVKPNSDQLAAEKELRRPCIIFMDSLGNANYKRSLSQPIREFLTLEWKSKKGFELAFNNKQTFRDIAPKVPNQTNSSDCGLFVLEYIQQFLKVPDQVVAKVMENSRKALITWFETSTTTRQAIRDLLLKHVSDPTVTLRLEAMIDDSKCSDMEDIEEFNEDEHYVPKKRVPMVTDDDDQPMPDDDIGMEVDKCCGTTDEQLTSDKTEAPVVLVTDSGPDSQSDSEETH